MKTESITTFECFAIWAVIGIVIVGIVESFSFVVFRPLEEDTGVSNQQQQCKIPILVLELYRIFAYFTLGKIFFKCFNSFGGIQQLCGQNFAIFYPHSFPPRGQFLYPERGQKQSFFDPLILST